MMKRGYSLPLVLLILTTLSVAVVALAQVVAASSKTTGAMLGRRKALYACDGVVRGLSVKAREYFATTPVPHPVTLRDFLCESPAPGCAAIDGWFPGFTVEAVTIGTGNVNDIGEISNGPFAGQSARRTDMTLKVELLHENGRRCRVAQNMVNGQIGLFQFAVFSGIPMDLLVPPTMNIAGRVHVNGNFCAGGNFPNLTIERITVSGTLDADCGTGSGFSVINRQNGAPVGMSGSNDGTSATWATSALTTWNGNALDRTHGVPNLRLPVATGSIVQPGANQGGGVVANTDTLRLMLDPPRTNDPPDVTAERLAEEADIRIINGAWFLNDGSFPGTPIWHDHHVAYPDDQHQPHEKDTADNLKRFTPPLPGAPAAPTPFARGYSFYERDAAGSIINNEGLTPSVVSYGRLTNNGRRVPGNGGVVAVNHADLLNAARNGFRDTRHAMDGDGAAAMTLPLNFDVGAFVTQLGNGNPNELGAVLAARGRPFNGIVWITSTWPDVHRGYGGNVAPAPAPAPDPARVPRALCGDFATVPLAQPGGIDTCTGPGATSNAYSAVRVLNARVIDPAVLPRGLTIATNLPLYSLGDVNTGSLVGGVPGTPRTVDPAGPWVPLMLAGDAYTMLSNVWDDAPRGAGADNGCISNAAETHVAAAVLAGHVQSTNFGLTTGWGGGINNFPRFLECWSGIPSRITGSLVIGFLSVHARDEYVFPSEGVYSAPQRFWGFDTNFANPAHQPPGTPSFFVQAVERWDRD
jgi:hypothetical protein